MAIEVRQRLHVAVKLQSHEAKFLFSVNGISYNSNEFEVDLDLMDPLNFSCEVFGGAVEIVNISINDKKILPIYLKFATPPTSWITGPWNFSITKPFYNWYHEITGQGFIA
jgi:hypothetical protein